jgi:thioredoxin-like negative regulator of GroEL
MRRGLKMQLASLFVVAAAALAAPALGPSAYAAGARPLDRLPEFTLQGLGNADLARADLAGRPAVVQFWASWCTSCGSVGADVAAALAETKAHVAYAAVSLDETVAAAAPGAAKLRTVRVPGKAYYFDRGRRLADALGDVAIPTVLVVAADGRIVSRLTGHLEAAQLGELRARLRELSGSSH